MMLAATVFFFIERDRVKGKWKTSLSVAGLVTGIAFWHYMYMRDCKYWRKSNRLPLCGLANYRSIADY